MDNNREIRDCTDEEVTHVANYSQPVTGWMIGWVAELHTDDDEPIGVSRQLMILLTTEDDTVAARFPAELAAEFVNDIAEKLRLGQ
jgi:hypothetical protein